MHACESHNNNEEVGREKAINAVYMGGRFVLRSLILKLCTEQEKKKQRWGKESVCVMIQFFFIHCHALKERRTKIDGANDEEIKRRREERERREREKREEKESAMTKEKERL